MNENPYEKYSKQDHTHPSYASSGVPQDDVNQVPVYTQQGDVAEQNPVFVNTESVINDVVTNTSANEEVSPQNISAYNDIQEFFPDSSDKEEVYSSDELDFDEGTPIDMQDSVNENQSPVYEASAPATCVSTEAYSHTELPSEGYNQGDESAEVNSAEHFTEPVDYDMNSASTSVDNIGQSFQAQTEASSFEWNGNEPVTNYAPPVYAPHMQTPQTTAYGYNIPKPKKTMPLAVILIICILVSVAFGGGSAILVNKYLDSKKDDSSSDKKSSVNYEVIDIAPGSELSTTSIVEKAGDSVVEIITEYVETGVFSQQFIKSGAGSGVIIDREGYIITNHHVIEKSQKISVTLRDGETYSAELIGSDAKMDLALLKISADNLTAAEFGNSDELKVGQRTIAIGNPLGQLGGTVTEGILSALDREVTVDGQTMNLLQTDTAINPGNSGGGLFDGKGNLIGIVVAKSSGSEVEGLGFAIPVNDAVDVISDLLEYGYVRGRVTVGMEFIDVLSEPIAWMYGLSDLGCYVYSVDEDSNAEKAGFKSGDLILSVDGVDVDTSDELEAILDKKAVGDTVEFKVKRGRKTGVLSLTLEEYVPESGLGQSNDLYIEWGN